MSAVRIQWVERILYEVSLYEVSGTSKGPLRGVWHLEEHLEEVPPRECVGDC